jgi:hypothetical protein
MKGMPDPPLEAALCRARKRRRFSSYTESLRLFSA